MHHSSRSFLHWLKWPAIALVSLLFASQVLAQNLVQNPSFETTGPTNWTVIVGQWGGWSQSTTLAAAAITDGSLAVASHNSDPGSEILYQDVTLPAAGTYSFQVAAGCLAKEAATEFCRVDITDTDPSTLVAPSAGTDTLATTTASGGAHILVPIFLHDGTSGNAPITDTAILNISVLAGQTVRVRLMAASPTGTDGYGSGLFDNVRLIQSAGAIATTTSVPTMSEWGLIVLALAMAGATFNEFGRRKAMQR
jgi:hypothetical protein